MRLELTGNPTDASYPNFKMELEFENCTTDSFNVSNEYGARRYYFSFKMERGSIALSDGPYWLNHQGWLSPPELEIELCGKRYLTMNLHATNLRDLDEPGLATHTIFIDLDLGLMYFTRGVQFKIDQFLLTV